MKFLALLTTLCLLAFTALACGEEEGGGSAEEGGTGEPDPAQEFTTEATEICADVNQQLGQIQDFPREGPPIIEEGLSNLEGLTPPPEQQETFDRFIQEGREGLRTVENAQEPPQRDPFAGFRRLGQELGIEGGCTGAGQQTEGQPPE